MFTLTIEDSNGQIADRFTFDHGAYVIGREKGCDILLPSRSVSRQHARIFVDNGRCYVEDLGSANGIMVDGQRVIKQRDLGTASQIKVGDYYLYLEYRRPDRGSHANVLQTLFISDDSDHCRLVRINDSFAGEEFSLSEVENTIGRTDDNFILLSDSSISRHHARIYRDGDKYTLMDLGSSNGTRLNGKALKVPQVLNSGDRIHFGNVEFVFVPGHAEVNPADFSGTIGGTNVMLMAVVGLLVLIGIAVGGLIVFSFFSMKDPQSQQVAAAETLEERVAELLQKGEGAMERRDWGEAVTTFNEVVALAPDHAQAQQLRERAEREQEAQELFERAELLVEQGRHRDARDLLEKVPESTVASERAAEQLRHVQKALAHKLKNEGLRLAKSKRKHDLIEAQEKLEEVLQLTPGDAEAEEALRSVEAALAK